MFFVCVCVTNNHQILNKLTIAFSDYKHSDIETYYCNMSFDDDMMVTTVKPLV